MNFFTFTKLGRTLLLAGVVAVSAVCWAGCGGDDNPSGGDNNGGNTNNSGNNNGNATHTHDWGDWVVTTPATCDADGVETRTCKLDASHKETRAIPKLTGAACNGGGDSYEFVEIGGLKWMKKNLNVETADSWCYDDDPANCATYGRLYTWEAAKTACPSGWRLSTRDEWRALATTAGGIDLAATKLKTIDGWYDSQGNSSNYGTDDYNFSAMPGGYNNVFGAGGVFSYIGYSGSWITATEADDGVSVYVRVMTSNSPKLYEYKRSKIDGNSVRCVMDE